MSVQDTNASEASPSAGVVMTAQGTRTEVGLPLLIPPGVPEDAAASGGGVERRPDAGPVLFPVRPTMNASVLTDLWRSKATGLGGMSVLVFCSARCNLKKLRGKEGEKIHQENSRVWILLQLAREPQKVLRTRSVSLFTAHTAHEWGGERAGEKKGNGVNAFSVRKENLAVSLATKLCDRNFLSSSLDEVLTFFAAGFEVRGRKMWERGNNENTWAILLLTPVFPVFSPTLFLEKKICLLRGRN